MSGSTCAGVGVDGRLGRGGFALGGDLTLDILKGITTIGLKIGMTECPAVVTKGVFLIILDLVEVILVKLTDKAGKVGVLEHAWEDRLCELGHVLEGEVNAIQDSERKSKYRP